MRRYTGAEFLEQQGSATSVVDVRPASQYANFHLQGTLQIGVDGPLASWAAILLAPEQKTLLIGDSFATDEEARARLQRVGLHDVIGYQLADEQGWREDLLAVRSLRVRRCVEIAAGVSLLDRAEFIDVRSKAEWLQGHVPGANCVPLLELTSLEVRRMGSGRVLLGCNGGFQAMIAASLFRHTGNAEVEVLLDGVDGWADAGFPLLGGDPGEVAEESSRQSSPSGGERSGTSQERSG